MSNISTGRDRLRLAFALMGTVSASALMFTGGALAQPIESVVVTGTHIRGVAPVGSTVISVTSEDLQKTGSRSTTDMLLRVPQIISMGYNEQTVTGGTRPQQAAGNQTFTRSLNLRGIGRQATLTLYDGWRFSKNGTDDSSDADLYPVSLVSRVEVVADGGSAIYGTDAVAGVVNIVLKEPEDLVETVGQAGIFDGGMNWLARQTLGTTWGATESGIGDGGLMIAFEHSYTDPLDAEDRPNLYPADISQYVGPAGLPLITANPGTIDGLTGPGVTATTTFAIPTGLTGTQAATLSRLGAPGSANRTSRWGRVRAIPQINRDTIAGVFKQELTDWLTFKGNAIYMNRNGGGTWGTNLTFRQALSVPNTNPYSPCNPAVLAANPAPAGGPACPANGTIRVHWTAIGDLQASVLRQFQSYQYGYTGQFDFELPYEWSGTLAGHYSKQHASVPYTNWIQSARLAQVISGVGKPANVPFLNPFCDSSAAPCNSQLTMDYVKAHVFIYNDTNWLNHYDLHLNGPLFDLPGGTVRLAAGGDWAKNSLTVFSLTDDNVERVQRVLGVVSHTNQTVKGLFAELYVPVIGSGNAMPGIQALELTLAGRITDYQFAGTTRDPKIGVNWKPIESLKLSASWGTSFRAPALREADPFSGSLIVISTLNCNQLSPVPAACAGNPAQTLTTLALQGGNSGLTPEEATTWSVGAEWTPQEFLPGLYTSVSYYNIDFKNLISSVATGLGTVGAVNAAGGIFDSYLWLNPTYFPTRAANNASFPINGTPSTTNTQAGFNNFVNPAATAGGLYNDPRYAGTPGYTGPVAFVIDGRSANSAELKTSGIDFQARYDWDMDAISPHVGIGGTYVLKYDVVNVAGLPPLDQLNQFSFNTQFRFRAEAGVEWQNWSGTLFLNYTNAYDILPALTHPAAPAGQFNKIDSNTTVDLALSYDTGEEVGMPLLRNIALSLNVDNVFDTDPPFVLNAAGNPLLFDPMNASPIGRLITLRVGKRW